MKKITKKVKSHFSENKEEYIRFGYYAAGVVIGAFAYAIGSEYGRNRAWDKLEAMEDTAEDRVLVIDRHGDTYLMEVLPDSED